VTPPGPAACAGGRLAAVLAALVLAAACSSPLGSQSTSTPTPQTALEKADAKFFSGDYQGAEQDYQQAIKDQTSDAHAHYALLLTYESRFREAVVEAQAGVKADNDSYSLGRMTRALDWSSDPSAAIAVGAKAVRTTPVDPLARVFYGEALADSGLYGESASQLRQAERDVKDGYGRAEVYREWANYYGDQADSDQQLNQLQLALKAQPNFPERAVEIARRQYENEKQATARGLLDGMKKKHSGDYWVLVGLGDTAGLGKDTDKAVEYYNAALAVKPGAAEASLALAETDVAINHDLKAGHDRALAGLKQNPTSQDLYEYVRNLDELALKTASGGDLATLAPPARLTADRKAALDLVNAARAGAGLPAIVEDPALDESTQAHAHYYLFNVNDQSVSGLGIHTEQQNLTGFTGADSTARAQHFGYKGDRTAEVIDHVFGPAASIDDWTNSVFHRFPILEPETQSMGFGEARLGLLSIQLIDFGLAAPSHAAAVVYPLDNQKDVPAAFVGNEIPDPAPQGAQYPLGYPLTLETGAGAMLAVSTGRLLGPDGQQVVAYELRPGSALVNFAWALLPAAPLTPGATYTVEVIGTLDGNRYTKRWSFTVVRP
jgi:tetratricopeptide (TPR) repeat protein